LSGDYRYVYEFFFKESSKDSKSGASALEKSNPFEEADATAETVAQSDIASDRYANLTKLMNFLKLKRLNYTAAGTFD